MSAILSTLGPMAAVTPPKLFIWRIRAASVSSVCSLESSTSSVFSSTRLMGPWRYSML